MMKKISLKITVMLLAFSAGVAIASIFYFDRSTAAPVPEPELEIEQPPLNAGSKTLEIVFVLDTTGSMGGLLEGAKQKIWGIVNEVMQKKSKPNVRVGLVAYRDRGDIYETQILPVTEDLDKVYSKLMEFQAAGGGDHPENVRKALADGVKNAGWSKAKGGVAQIVFLVGDAPPQNYRNEPDVLATADFAVKQNMIVNTIQCGTHSDTIRIWNQIAQHGQGKYFAIAQDGGVEVINTPYDEEISQLGRKIGSSYMAYGSKAEQAAKTADVETTELSVANAAPSTARADRALNKALNSEAYGGDFIQEIENGRVKLESVKADELPVELQKMSAPERRAEVDKRLTERKKVREQIIELSKKRAEYVEAERKKTGKQNGFDAAVGIALSEQLAKNGIE